MAKTRTRQNKRNKTKRRRRMRRGGEELKQVDIMYPDKSYLAPP